MTLDQCLNIPLAEALVLIDGPDTAHIPQHLDHDNDIGMCEIDAVCNIRRDTRSYKGNQYVALERCV